MDSLPPPLLLRQKPASRAKRIAGKLAKILWRPAVGVAIGGLCLLAASRPHFAAVCHILSKIFPF